MKYSILFLFVFLSFSGKSLAQNIEDCGKDDNPLLTLEEAVFLKKYFEEIRDTDFDFKDKKILFVTGSGGTIISTKSAYFKDINDWEETHNSTIATFVDELTDKEKAEFGYDAIITRWVKIFTPKARKKVLKKSKKLEILNLKQNNK